MFRTLLASGIRHSLKPVRNSFGFCQAKGPNNNRNHKTDSKKSLLSILQHKADQIINMAQQKLKAQDIKNRLDAFSTKLVDRIKHVEYDRYFNQRNLILVLMAGAIAYFYNKNKYLDTQSFNVLLSNQEIAMVKFVNNETKFGTTKYLDITTRSGRRLYYIVMDFGKVADELSKTTDVKLEFVSKNDFGLLLDRYGFFLLGAGFIILLYIMNSNMLNNNISKASGGAVDVGKRKYEMVKNVQTRFKDVAGMEQSKLEIQQFVDILKHPEKYKAVGAKIPRGALLTGPPGTGKTLLAKACAGEAGVPFFFTSGSEFVQKYVGVGASRIRDLFKQAKAMSPSIIWIDEIDAIGRKRTNDMGSNDEKDGTLNQLLVEMDGFNTDAGVIILAATNRSELLDKALTRPGRFDRIIEVDLPDLKERKQIFMVHLAPITLSPKKTIDQYAKRLATLTPGFSGADISNICNQAAILAARKNKSEVQTIDFELATQKVLGGVERTKLLSEEERRIVAIHESGHAVVSWFLEGASPLLKVTIVPRSKGALGFAQYLPSQSKLQTRQQLIDTICFILGGRCSQEVFFGRVTTGAYDDLQKAYSVAQSIVTQMGMGETIQPLGYRTSEFYKEYSEETATQIDKEISDIIKKCSQITRGIIRQRRDLIQKLADRLLEKQTLDAKSIMEVLGRRPFVPHENYQAYLDIYHPEEQDAPKKLPES